jgi:hypothetical protein
MSWGGNGRGGKGNYAPRRIAAQKMALKKFLMLRILSPPANLTGMILRSGSSSGSTSKKVSAGCCAIM